MERIGPFRSATPSQGNIVFRGSAAAVLIRITFLDVGAVIETPRGHTSAIDTGGKLEPRSGQERKLCRRRGWGTESSCRFSSGRASITSTQSPFHIHRASRRNLG